MLFENKCLKNGYWLLYSTGFAFLRSIFLTTDQQQCGRGPHESSERYANARCPNEPDTTHTNTTRPGQRTSWHLPPRQWRHSSSLLLCHQTDKSTSKKCARQMASSSEHSDDEKTKKLAFCCKTIDLARR